MCEKCNEALMAASQSALNLAKAAQILNSFHRNDEANVLAKAAADLFTEVKEEAVDGAKGSPETEKPKARSGFSIDEEAGVVYLGDVPIGRIVHLGQKTAQ